MDLRRPKLVKMAALELLKFISLTWRLECGRTNRTKQSHSLSPTNLRMMRNSCNGL
jgi:hypothetical protein